MRRVLIVFALLLWLPAAAAAAPVPADAYLDRLHEAFALLADAELHAQLGEEADAEQMIRAAADLLEGVEQVESGAGRAEVDLTDLVEALGALDGDPAAVKDTRRALEEHLHAARELLAAEPVQAPGARAVLDRALTEVAGQSFLQRAREWFYGLFSRQMDRVDLGPLPPLAFWIGGAVGALALGWAGFALYRSLTGHGAGREGVWRGDSGPAADRPPSPPELLQAAKEAAGRSDYLGAVRLAHLALLMHLDRLGAIHYQPSQTNREHERQLARQRPELVPALRSLHDLLEGCLYGGHPARADEFRRAESLVMQLWREGDALSGSAAVTPGRSSSASSH